MKAERRHELKESDLTHALESGRRYLEGHGKTIGAGVVVVVVIVLGTTFAQSARRSATEDRWTEKRSLAFDTPENTKKSLATLAVLARESGDDRFALAALMDQGNQALRSATSDSGKPDPEFNDIAKSAFEALLDRFPRNALANGIAHLGLATVAENRFVLDEAVAHKAEALKHLEAVLSDSAMHTLPFYQIALDRKSVMDDTFTVVAFAPPLTPVGDSAGGDAPGAPDVPGAPTIIDSMPGFRIVDPPEWAKDLPPLQKPAPAQTQTKSQDDQPQGADEDQGSNAGTTDAAPAPQQPAKEDAPPESPADPKPETATDAEPEPPPESDSPPTQKDP